MVSEDFVAFSVSALQAQDLGRAQGFPADPVICAAYDGDRCI